MLSTRVAAFGDTRILGALLGGTSERTHPGTFAPNAISQRWAGSQAAECVEFNHGRAKARPHEGKEK
jgi:hypothetical protein